MFDIFQSITNQNGHSLEESAHAYPSPVFSDFSALLAARDWYPQISEAGAVSEVVRFIDLDTPHPENLSALEARVCLLIGVTRNPSSQTKEIAKHLDLTLSSSPIEDQPYMYVPDLDDAMNAISRAVEQRGRSALVLAATLRQTSQLPIADAIAAEASAYSTLLGGPEFAEWLSSRKTKNIASNEIERVLTSITGNTLNIRMNRKLRLNAIDAAMRAELVEAFSIALADPTLDVKLTGVGPCFSNGGDLREFGTSPDVATAWSVRMSQHPGWYLSQIAERATVHMHGNCIGAGVEMPAFASHVIADPETTFLLPELAMGLIPGAGGCVSIPRRIGRWRTLWLVLTGTRLNAQEALAIGLIDDIAAIN